MFIFVRCATPVARERAPTGCIRGPRGCTCPPAAHGNSTGSGVLSRGEPPRGLPAPKVFGASPQSTRHFSFCPILRRGEALLPQPQSFDALAHPELAAVSTN